MTVNLFFVFPEINSDNHVYRNAGGIYSDRLPLDDDLSDAARFLAFLPELIGGEENLTLYYSRLTLRALLDWISSFDDEYPNVSQMLISNVCFTYMQPWEDNRKSPDDYSLCIDNCSVSNNIVSEASYRIIFCNDTQNALVDINALDAKDDFLHFHVFDTYEDKMIRRLLPDIYNFAHYLAHERQIERKYDHNSKHRICSKKLSRSSHASPLSCSQEKAQILLQTAFGTKKILCAYNCSVQSFVAFRSHMPNHWHGYDITYEELVLKGFSQELLRIIQFVAPA